MKGLNLNLIQHFHDTIAQDNEQKSLEQEHLEKVKNSSSMLYSGTTTLSPITECDPVEQFEKEINSDGPRVGLDSSVNNKNQASHLSVTSTQIEPDETKGQKCKTDDEKNASDGGSLALSGASMVHNDVDIKSLDNAINNLSIEEETPPPVAPPRRKRKKKPNADSSKEQVCMIFIQ